MIFLEREPLVVEDTKQHEIKDIHNAQLIFYAFINHRIKGPYTIDQLISLYVFNELHDDIIYLKPASQLSMKDWFPIKSPYPNADRDSYVHLESEYPELFDKFVEPIIDGAIQQIGPFQIPTQQKKQLY